MRIPDLVAAIDAADAWNLFTVRTEARPESQPSDKTVLEPTADGTDRWVVYYSERGQILDPQYFDSEDAAGAFVYTRLTTPRRPSRQTTPEEDQVAAELKVQADQRRRQSLIDAGYDPETLRPRE